MKKIFMCLSLCMILCGCISGPGYERSSEMATINNTSWEAMMEKMKKDETFMFMVTFEECSSCEYFTENVLNDYIKNHGFELNVVHFTEDLWFEMDDQVKQFIVEHPYSQEVVNKVSDYEEGTLLTPTLYFIQNGEVKDILVGGNISGIDLDSMIVKYRLDGVK